MRARASAALLVLGGCSLIVPAELEAVRCSDEGAIGPPACDPGWLCRAGECVACRHADVCGNGVDDDCDGTAEEGCPDAGGTGGTSSGGTGGADAADAPGLPGLGEPCGSRGECAAGLVCLDPATLWAESAPAVCTRACCSSDECGTAHVCWAAPSGGSVCRAPDEVGRSPAGVAAVGQACGDGAECRSGACAGACVDACCRDSDCTAGAPDCTLWTPPGSALPGFACGDALGAGAYHDVCFSDADCRSGLCVDLGPASVCSRPCCRSSDCGGITIPSLGTFDFQCDYADVGGSLVRACVRSGPSGTLDTGEACTGDNECHSRHCLLSAAICTDACCRDDDCGDTSLLECRHLDESGRWVSRCALR